MKQLLLFRWRKSISLLTALLAASSGFAQTCDCKAALDFTVQKIEANYSGFKDKVRLDNQAAYQAFTDSLQVVAAAPAYQRHDSCYSLLNRWLGFLKDGHTYINYTFVSNVPMDVNADSVRQLYARWPKVNHDAASFANYLATNKKRLKPLEGVWQMEGGAYKVGIIYQGHKYRAFILKADSLYWMPGQVKFEIIPEGNTYVGTFYLRNHIGEPAVYDLANINDGYIQTGIRGRWYKLDENGKLLLKSFYPGFGIANFKRLSAKTNLFTIKSFDGNYRRLIDSLITANDSLLRHTDNLIIDLRGNGGGSDYAHYPLHKYLYTNPYKRYGIEVYTSKDNIDKFRALAVNPNIKKNEQEDYLKWIALMEQHPNQFYARGDTVSMSDTLEVLPYPKRVAVLIDKDCASATEQFLIEPVQHSAKATIYGQPSAGIKDYSNLHWLTIPNTPFELYYPTTRSRRVDVGLGIDNKGVQPHVLLDNTTKDWVKYVQRELEKK